MQQQQQGDLLKMSTDEQGGMDVHQGVEGEHKKKGMMSKVKNKAKKLGTKIKSSTKKKSRDEHGNDVDGTSSSSSGEEDSDPHPTSGYDEVSQEAHKDGVAHGGDSGYKPREFAPETDDKSGLSQIGKLSEDPSAHDSNQAPSWDETQKSEEQVPSALGQKSAGAGISSGFGSDYAGKDQSGDYKDKSSSAFGSDTSPSSVAAGGLLGNSGESVPEGIMKPTKSGHEEDVKPVVDGVDSSGRDLLASEVTDSEQQKVEGDRPSFGEVYHKGDEASTDLSDPTNKELKQSASQKGWMQRATEGVTSMKNVLLGSPKSSSATPVSGPDVNMTETEAEQGKTWTDKARDTALSAKETVTSKLPSSTAPKDVSVTDQAMDSAASAEHKVADTAASTEHKAADTSSTLTSRALETATGLKDTVATKLGYGTGRGTGTGTGPESVGTGTETNKATPGVTQKVVEMKDAVASKLGYGTGTGTGTGPESVGTGTETNKATPGVTQKVVQMKDAVVSKLGYGTGTGTGTGPESVGTGTETNKATPGVTQKVVQMKDAVASKLGYGSSDAATDESGSKYFTPDEHDTALSQKITDMLTLGGGTKGTAATEGNVDTTTAAAGSPQGKGVYDRVTGAVGSLLGKKTDEKPLTESVEPKPALSEQQQTS